MRIAQVMLARNFGGAERSFVDTSRALAERSHEVLAICHKDFVKKESLEGIPNLTLKTVNSHGEWDVSTPHRLHKLILDFDADVVHTQLKRAAWHTGRALRREKIPVIAKLHNYVALNKYRHIDMLIATTEDQKRHALNLGWPEQRVRVLPNFSRIEPAESAKQIQDGKIRILSYGRYVQKKGFDLLLNAFADILADGIDAELVIGGSGPELDNLKALSRKLGIKDRVNLGVWLDDVSQALDHADLFVLPSLDEPFGIVVLEAMARGIPMVCTKTQGPSQILSSENAYLTEKGSSQALAEAIKQSLSSRDEASNKAQKALELYRSKYYQQAIIPRLEKIYRLLISR
ncbi:Glycosyltransferase KanE [Sedimentisphaera cyanobacteriorum]|uniref:Glycosyltransferase KanE n=1 Tax=Sedimentisphaera cyanobacteriorum TaxID=1940790 RepID=A0A1Q2HPN3_9BACT|nr:glycosyltransferase family 4 protein [Sedimentisphaera cyanobacteriorum]AQQ09291.1 Glycosyltransferase KanE [Sedimentisphaera cyanobacteriorum]